MATLKNSYIKRMGALRRDLAKRKLGAFLISHPANLTYLSGFTGHEAFGVVTDKGAYLITDPRYTERAHQEVTGFKVITRDRTQTLWDILPGLTAQKTRKGALGFEADASSYAFYANLKKRLRSTRIVPTNGIVELLRVTKDRYEISAIRSSAQISLKGIQFIKKIAKAGMTERELEGRLIAFLQKEGAEKPSFDIIIASGSGSAIPHYGTAEVAVMANAPLLIDMGVIYKSYASDLTRNIFLGTMPPLYRKLYDIVKRSQEAGIAAIRPGVRACEVDKASRDVIEAAGFGKFFGHSTGHGIGLEVHEAPRLTVSDKTVLSEGMVVTVEPGIYLPGQFGVRIEDMILVTASGREILTKED